MKIAGRYAGVKIFYLVFMLAIPFVGKSGAFGVRENTLGEYFFFLLAI
ncbi:MAG TPA: hypothetical protein VEB86_04125 [Chryseosolibacter sp.]|nr:hypothetical protein [Chryseosolibacter sp.]